MDRRLSRRNFLGNAALTGGALLLPHPPAAGQTSQKVPAGKIDQARRTGQAAGSDLSVHNLTRAEVSKVRWKAEPFSMTEVKLLPGPWKTRMELNRSFLYSLPNERLAHNFRVTAGIPSDAEPLGGWEAPDCELRGHYVGHYLSACALTHAGAGDEAMAAKASALIAMLAECQSKDGYLGAYPVEFYDRLRRYAKVWAPFYTYHKIVAGMLDMHEHTGNEQALTVATHMMDWADAYAASFSEQDWQKVLLVEQGGMNEAAFNLFAITGKTRYRDLAFRFEHKKFFAPLADNLDHLDGNHANTNIPKVIGAARGYELTGDPRYRKISENFYRIVTEHHTYCTGGTSDGELWHAPDVVAKQLGPDAQECCCSYNMMKLGRHLFGQDPDPKYFDYYERLLFNVRAGTQDRNGMLMYYVPLEPGMYKTFGTPFDAFWCCTGTGSEEFAKLNDSIYFHDDDAVYVNLFLPSLLTSKETGLTLRQTTQFPKEEATTLTIEQPPNRPMALKIRVPYWAAAGAEVHVNGEPQKLDLRPSTYARVERNWKAGDKVTIALPMSRHVAPAPDNPEMQAAMYGPLVLAARLGTDGLTTSMIYAGGGPRSSERYPVPVVESVDTKAAAAEEPWFERVESTPRYTMEFRTRGNGLRHALAPLAEITDERYSVYLRVPSKA